MSPAGKNKTKLSWRWLLDELRRREVFRTAGLYVGVAWILIEASSVLLPAFEAPEWVLRALIILAVIGLPVTIVLAWVYDVTESGIEVQGDPTDTVVVPFGGRKQSGNGRDKSLHAFEKYTEVKATWIKLDA